MTDSTRKRKPFYRPRNVIWLATIVIVLTIGWIAFETIRVMVASPTPTTDYRSQQVERVARELGIDPVKGQEAWNLLVETGTLCSDTIRAIQRELRERHDRGELPERFSNDGPYLEFGYLTSRSPDSSIAERELAALRGLRDAGVFDRLQDFAARAPGIDGRPRSGMILFSVSQMGNVRMLAIAAAPAIRLAADAGQIQEVASLIDAVLAARHSVAFETGLVSYMVACATESLILQELRCVLMEHDFDEATARTLLDILDRRRLDHVALVLELERLAFHDIVQHQFTDDGDGNGYFVGGTAGTLNGQLTFFEAFNARFRLASRRDAIAKYDELMDRTIAELDKPHMDRWQAGFDPEDAAAALGSEYTFVANMFGAIRKAINASEITSIQERGTALMLAIESYQARHGRVPTMLSDLWPEILPTPMLDPLHGGPFGYRVLDGDEHGREYLLYSTGFDATDDGGREFTESEHKNGSHAAVADPDARGVDFVINRPRPAWGAN